ncbi:hypothetical protein [Mycolicibacterium frederiksbergense]|uniref:Uncharacterized protein n=1 Tax=Mycolicibacterium frederiksbergense TaxID=117567 RepID=A0A6H0RZA5_9MYCO|nr:hypothetical protein [Mycolicibacterium frederiksbergense]QIV79569.1 hypothetical protein EXE63_00525 [Mycolicibacterium frederiksbergense]
MGFYDTTCLITGINLGSSVDTAVVMLHRTPDGHYCPISMGIHGTYDGFGCIESVPADLNAALLTRFFSAAHRTGRFQAHDHTHAGDPHWFDPDIDIESLLFLVERTTTCSNLYDGPFPPGTVLDGHPVVFAMIAQPVWDAIAAQNRSPRANLTTAAFGPGADIAASIYGQHLGQLVEPLRQFAAVSDFIASRPLLRWAPPNDPVQRYPRGSGVLFSTEESRRFVEDARAEYRGYPAIQNALDTYVRSND